jgi:hypothetical protein
MAVAAKLIRHSLSTSIELEIILLVFNWILEAIRQGYNSTSSIFVFYLKRKLKVELCES